ncbi:UNVERIFIED_CONTAM: hypothetical protein FKN15_034310 [Acipenser sinensis]
MIKAASLPLAACLLVTFHLAVVTLPYSQPQAGNLTDTPIGLYPAPSLVDTTSPTPPALDSVKILTSGPTHLLPVSLTDTGNSSLFFSGSQLVLTPFHQYYGSSSQPSTIPVLEPEPPVLPVSPQRLRASTDQLEIISASDLQQNFI